MELHETWCPQNPKNLKACTCCTKLTNIKIPYTGNHGIDRHANGFFCPAIGKQLYPLKAERMNLPYLHPHTFEDQVPMPKTCEYSDYNTIFKSNDFVGGLF